MGEPARIEGCPPPHDLDAEAAVLSAVLLSREAFDRVADILKAEHFYSDSNGRIYEAAQALALAGTPVDIVSVGSYLRDRGRLQQIGGASYVAQLADATPAVAHVEAHAKVVYEKWRLRALIATCQRVSAKGYGDVGEVQDFIDAAHVEIGAIKAGAPIDTGRVLGVRPLDVDAIFERLPPIKWVCRDLQLGPGRCNLLVGYSGSAKSMFALSLCIAVAVGQPVLGKFPTTHANAAATTNDHELPPAEVHRVRYLSADSGTRAARGRAQRIAKGMGATPDALRERFDIVARPTVRLTDPKAREAYTAAATGVGLLVVDALRPLIPDVEENASEVRAYIDLLTDVSEQTGCTIVLLHHEGKSGGTNGGRGHKADDEAARGSSSIQDAGGAIWRVIREEKDGADAFLVKMSKPPEEPPGPKPEPFYFRIEDIEVDGEPRAGIRLAYRTQQQVHPPAAPTDRLETLLTDALAYIESENREGRGITATRLSLALHIHDRKASALLAILADERSAIVNRPVWDRGEKPRWWTVALAPPITPAEVAATEGA